MKKSKSSTEMRSKIAKRMQELGREPTEELTGQEAVNAVMGLHVVVSESAKIVTPIEPKPQIVLYLREGLNAAESNFTKYPNGMHPIMTEHLDKEYEGILYIYLWRNSFGYGRNYCRTSYLDIQKNTLIRSRKTAQRAIASLAEKHFVIRARLDDGLPNVNQQGALYRIMTPNEIRDQRTEEGVLLAELPPEGMVCQAIPSLTIAENIDNSRVTGGMAAQGMASQAIGQTGHTPIGHTAMDSQAIPSQTTPDTDQDHNKPGVRYGPTGHTLTDHPFKEDSLKDSLSSLKTIISGFYRKIGQSKIAKTKRERGFNVGLKLRKDGFSLEDIAFAVKWTLENAEKEPYDFAIIEHTIGQALAGRDKIESQSRAIEERDKVLEEERLKLKTEERERQEIQTQKASLSPGEREELREEAQAELIEAGVSEGLINDFLLNIKENEILRNKVEQKR